MSIGPTFITNANEFVARLNRSAEKIKEPRAFLEQCRRLLTEQEAEVWSSEGATLDAAWKELVQPERKVSGNLLVDSGALRDSMSSEGAGRIRGATLRIHPKPFYGRFHQFGTVSMDARPFSGINDTTYRELMRLYQQQVDEDLGV